MTDFAESLAPGRILVTGAAGFIGAHVVRELAARGLGDRVIALDDLSGGYRENLPDSIDFREASITDRPYLDRLFEEESIDYVIHLAAYAAEGLSHFIRRFNYTNNVVGSVTLINKAVECGVKRFLFTSSIAVYGAGQVPMLEEMTPEPEDPYGIAKYAVELDLKAAHDMFGLDYVIFRPHNVYGEYQNIADRYRNVVGIFMNQILKGEPLTIFGDGEQQRAFSYVSQVSKPIVDALSLPGALGGTFNVGAETPFTVNELAETLCRVMGAEGHPVSHLPERNEVKIAYADHSRATEVFGTPEAVSLEEGLKIMAQWVREVGARETPRFDDIEVERGLPAVWIREGD